jgi:regulator of sirC expression with transglutaminase-like and TPR domain
MTAEALADFERLVQASPLPLLDAAAQVGRYADRACDPARITATVHGWGQQLAARIPADASAAARWRHLNHFFFDELRFQPNHDNYYEVGNSLLHHVLERRTGIPITLSLLYMEIGRHVGLTLNGVGFPGHFLVRLAMTDKTMFVDVFARGVPLSVDMLHSRLHAALGAEPEYPLEVYLRVASERDILARLLRNLKRVHLQANELTACLEVQHRLVAVLPDEAQERRTRAMLYERLQCPRAAALDLAAYLQMSANPPDAVAARDRLHQLQQAADRLN